MEILGIILFGLLAICWIWYSFLKHSGTLNSYITSKFLFSGIVGLAFLPLFLGFLIRFLNQFFESGDKVALTSFLLFTGFAVSYIAKLITQAILLIEIQAAVSNYEDQSNPQVQSMLANFKNSYSKVVFISPIILSGLIPFLHLLTVWVAAPLAMSLAGIYSERKFFEEMASYLAQRPTNPVLLPLDFLRLTIWATVILAPLLIVALFTGLMSLNF